MTEITKKTYQCDGCLEVSESKEFIEASYSIAKNVWRAGGSPTKYVRDYCKECLPKLVAAHKEGAFINKRKELV